MGQIPDFHKINLERKSSGTDGGVSFYTAGLHPNPRFYKYYWWVFWRGSPVDGKEFLTKPYRVCSSTAFQLIEDFKARSEPCWVYNEKIPRKDPLNTPFDLQSLRWTEWASAYDNDPDPAVTLPLGVIK